MKTVVLIIAIDMVLFAGFMFGKWYMQYNHNVPGMEQFADEKEFTGTMSALFFGILCIFFIKRSKSRPQRFALDTIKLIWNRWIKIGVVFTIRR